MPAKTLQRIKVLTAGDAGVGKSCLVKRYCEQRFVSEYVSTIGIDYGVKDWIDTEKGQTYKINFWDVAGDSIYTNVRSEFYNADVDVLLLVFDVRSRASFESLKKWIEEFEGTIKSIDAKPQSARKWIVGNKIDLGDRVVSSDDAREYAKQQGFRFIETSAQSGENVDFLFDTIFRELALTKHFNTTKQDVNQRTETQTTTILLNEPNRNPDPTKT